MSFGGHQNVGLELTRRLNAARQASSAGHQDLENEGGSALDRVLARWGPAEGCGISGKMALVRAGGTACHEWQQKLLLSESSQ